MTKVYDEKDNQKNSLRYYYSRKGKEIIDKALEKGIGKNYSQILDLALLSFLEKYESFLD